jgi:hypothetical protein
MMPFIIWTAPTQVVDAAVGHLQKRWRVSQRLDPGRFGTLQDDPDDLESEFIMASERCFESEWRFGGAVV